MGFHASHGQQGLVPCVSAFHAAAEVWFHDVKEQVPVVTVTEGEARQLLRAEAVGLTGGREAPLSSRFPDYRQIGAGAWFSPIRTNTPT